MYDKLVAKVNNIDTKKFVFKTKYDLENSDLEKTIPDTSGLVKKTDYIAKIAEIENKTSSIGGLATTFALATLKNKIPNISSLVKNNRL